MVELEAPSPEGVDALLAVGLMKFAALDDGARRVDAVSLRCHLDDAAFGLAEALGELLDGGMLRLKRLGARIMRQPELTERPTARGQPAFEAFDPFRGL